MIYSLGAIILKSDSGWQKRLFFPGETARDLARLQFLCNRLAKEGASPQELLDFARSSARELGMSESAH